MARWRRLQRNMDQESELNTKGMIATGPWSIEEMKEKQWERLEVGRRRGCYGDDGK